MATPVTLPPGVVKLGDGEPCPPMTLGLYRDYSFQGPAFGIGAGYNVELKELPIPPSGTMAKNVSAWVNNTDATAILVSMKDGKAVERPLPPGRMEEPREFNDSVIRVKW